VDDSPERALLSVPEAAALAGFSRAVAYRLVREDRLPGVVRLPGRRLRVRRRVLEAWLAGGEAAVPDPPGAGAAAGG